MPVSPASSWRTWIDVGRVMNTVRSVGTRLGVSQRSAQVSLLPTQHSTGGRYAHRPQNLAQTRLQQLGVGGVLTLLVLLLLYFDSGAPKAGSSQYILVQPHDSGSSSSGSSSSVSSISSSVTSGGAPLQGPAGGGGGGGGGTGVTPAAQCRALAALQVRVCGCCGRRRGRERVAAMCDYLVSTYTSTYIRFGKSLGPPKGSATTPSVEPRPHTPTQPHIHTLSPRPHSRTYIPYAHAHTAPHTHPIHTPTQPHIHTLSTRPHSPTYRSDTKVS